MSRDVPPDLHASRACRWCGQPLSALARVRGDVCDAMDCRRQAVDAQLRARRAADLARVRAAAAGAWDAPELAHAPVVWLRHHGAELAPPAADAVAELRAHLVALEADKASAPPADGAAAGAAATPAIGGQLCALCRGRCCRFGLPGKAFIEAHQLRAWLASRPDAGWRDAVEHWLGFVAPEHLDASCLFHAPTGCTLPRERRSDVCNQFACDALEQAHELATARPDVAVMAGIVGTQGLQGAAVVTAQGSRALPGIPQVP